MKGQKQQKIQVRKGYVHKYTSQEQKDIIQVYNNYDDKTIALKQIKSLIQCKYLTQQKILHWMSKLKTGKAISSEFEDEVMVECNKLYNINYCDIKNNNNLNIKKNYSYSNIRECAKKIFDKDYWDESNKVFIKKWHHDRRTYKLLFTNKWVCGMLKRYSERKESDVASTTTSTDTSTSSTTSTSTTTTTTSTTTTSTTSNSSNSKKSSSQVEPFQQYQQIETIATYPSSMSVPTIFPFIPSDKTATLPSSSSSQSSSNEVAAQSSSTQVSPPIYPLRKVKIEPTLLEDIKILMLMRCLHPHDYESQHNYLSFS